MCRFAALFASAPKTDYLRDGDLTAYFNLLLKRFLQKGRLAANLHNLTADTDVALRKISPFSAMEPFDVMFNLVYQLTHRTLGSHDVAADPGLLAETLAAFGSMDRSSAIDVMFPSLPTPNKLRRMWAGAKLHWAFQKIMDDRRKTGRTEADAMQEMMDQGDNDIVVSSVSPAHRSRPDPCLRMAESLTLPVPAGHHRRSLRRPHQQRVQRRLDPLLPLKRPSLVRRDAGRGRRRRLQAPAVRG